MKKLITSLLLAVVITSFGPTNLKNEKIELGEIKISWTDNLPGDFSFAKKWEYPEGVYKNKFKQLSCDGLCPPETDRMKDKNGKIFKDSLKAFYKLVDTTHQYYSVRSEVWCYEWAGTNFAIASKTNKDTVICFTQNNAATHSSLNLIITKDKCIPTIELYSIMSSAGNKTYTCKSGQIEIDKNLWDKGILKAKFDFIFNHPENPNKPMYWKGKIYTAVKAK